MVRFYFEMRDGGGAIQDFEGEEFKDLTDARKEAQAALRELVAGDIASAAQLRPRSIAIHDEHQNILAVVGAIATLVETFAEAGGLHELSV